MCDKCNFKHGIQYWLHIADNWTEKEKEEMLDYLNECLISNLPKKKN